MCRLSDGFTLLFYLSPSPGQLQQWKHTNAGSPRHAPTPLMDSAGEEMGEVWAELGVGSSGFLDKQELSLVCESIGLRDLDTEVKVQVLNSVCRFRIATVED